MDSFELPILVRRPKSYSGRGLGLRGGGGVNGLRPAEKEAWILNEQKEEKHSKCLFDAKYIMRLKESRSGLRNETFLLYNCLQRMLCAYL